eukprot:scaffold66597_cov33-Tisochrysis_lutea.AAC.1
MHRLHSSARLLIVPTPACSADSAAARGSGGAAAAQGAAELAAWADPRRTKRCLAPATQHPASPPSSGIAAVVDDDER